MANSPRLRAILDLSRRQIAEGGGIPHEQFWAEMASARTPKRRGKAVRKLA